MLLSQHFPYEEMVFSETAVRHNIDNTPPDICREELIKLCENELEHVRILVGRPVDVVSGYRCAEVNGLVGGASNSQHVKGQAADIKVKGMTTQELFDLISGSAIRFDQLIFEGTWVHISRADKPRRQRLYATFIKGSPTVYTSA